MSCTTVRERYRPELMTANSTFKIPQGIQSIGGFICTVSGSLTVTDGDGNTIVNALPVTAGIYHPLPIYLGSNGRGSVVLSGGATGTLCI